MKHTLNVEERGQLDRRIADAEKRTGAQIVLAVIERSDSYAELPWKAFALGASIAGFLVLGMNLLWPLPSPTTAALLAIVMMLSAAAGFALLCVFSPDFARLFLHAHRAEVEIRQYAESLFLSKQMFTTTKRKAVLLLVSIFERQIFVLPDTGLVSKLNQEATDNIIQHMRPYLIAGKTARAL
ncbi:MAG: TPM domain-containing protein, partial [Deltaproteobacteria bacterium]